jgi:hypothetical protein
MKPAVVKFNSEKTIKIGPQTQNEKVNALIVYAYNELNKLIFEYNKYRNGHVRLFENLPSDEKEKFIQMFRAIPDFVVFKDLFKNEFDYLQISVGECYPDFSKFEIGKALGEFILKINAVSEEIIILDIINNNYVAALIQEYDKLVKGEFVNVFHITVKADIFMYKIIDFKSIN